jgi:hypothetical protein
MSTECYSGYGEGLRDRRVYIATGYGIAQWILRMSTKCYSENVDILRNSTVDIATFHRLVLATGMYSVYNDCLPDCTLVTVTVYRMVQWI